MIEINAGAISLSTVFYIVWQGESYRGRDCSISARRNSSAGNLLPDLRDTNGATDVYLRRWAAPERDGDGVPDSEEQGPQGDDPDYDGNGDGIPDGEQANVASLHSQDGAYYVTLASPAGTRLEGVQAVANPSPGDAPAEAGFPAGFYRFRVTCMGAGAATQVEIVLPAGSAPDGYYKYGATPDAPDPHWYAFDHDGTTGAVIEGDRITLHLVDGGQGDDDLSADGSISDDGAPAWTAGATGGDGTGAGTGGGATAAPASSPPPPTAATWPMRWSCCASSVTVTCSATPRGAGWWPSTTATHRPSPMSSAIMRPCAA